MAEKRAIDIAVHWMPKREQYRLRFMRYWGGYIYYWYYYFPEWFSGALQRTGNSRTKKFKFVVMLVIYVVVRFMLGVYRQFEQLYIFLRKVFVYVLLFVLGLAAFVYIFAIPIILFLAVTGKIH